MCEQIQNILKPSRLLQLYFQASGKVVTYRIYWIICVPNLIKRMAVYFWTGSNLFLEVLKSPFFLQKFWNESSMCQLADKTPNMDL